MKVVTNSSRSTMQLIDIIQRSTATDLDTPVTVHNNDSSQQPTLSANDLDTSELVELLQRSAVEHLTTYRQLETLVL